MMTVLKQADEEPKSGVHRAEVTMLDDRQFSASFPLAASDYPVNFFLEDKQVGRTAIVPHKENQNTEPEESRTKFEEE